MVNTVSYRCYRFNALFCSMSPYKARNGSKASVHWPVDLASPSLSSFFTLLFLAYILSQVLVDAYFRHDFTTSK